MLSRAWRHIEHNLKEGGPRQVLRKIVYRMGQWAWSESPWLTYRLEAASCALAPRLPLERRTLELDELLQLGYYKALSFPEMVRDRLGSGAACHGFFLDGVLVNIAWTTRDHLDMEPGLVLREPSSVGIFDCFTFPEHRGKGIYLDTLIRLIRDARDAQVSTVWIAVHPQNLPSIKAIERAGFEPHRRIVLRRRAGRASRAESSFEPVIAKGPRPGA